MILSTEYWLNIACISFPKIPPHLQAGLEKPAKEGLNGSIEEYAKRVLGDFSVANQKDPLPKPKSCAGCIHTDVCSLREATGLNDEKLANFCKHYMETEPCGKSKVFACNTQNMPGEWRREEIG